MHVQRSKSSSSSSSDSEDNRTSGVSKATQVGVISPSKREPLGLCGATYIHTYICTDVDTCELQTRTDP